jgi:multiple sugar transport system ATP-binding protein
MIYVTHDQIEAMTLADRIAIMRSGVIQQLDTPHNIYNRPVNLFVAGFIGSPSMNFINGELQPSGDPVFNAEGISVPLKGYKFDGSAPVGPLNGVLGIRPEHVAIGAAAAQMPFSAESEIEIVEPMGSDTIAWTKLAGQPFTFRCESEVILEVGQKIRIGFDPARGSVFDAATGDRV